MAVVIVKMGPGRSGEVKDRLVQGIADVIAREIDPDPSHLRIIIEEVSAENYAVGGRRICNPASD